MIEFLDEQKKTSQPLRQNSSKCASYWILTIAEIAQTSQRADDNSGFIHFSASNLLLVLLELSFCSYNNSNSTFRTDPNLLSSQLPRGFHFICLPRRSKTRLTQLVGENWLALLWHWVILFFETSKSQKISIQQLKRDWRRTKPTEIMASKLQEAQEHILLAEK